MINTSRDRIIAYVAPRPVGGRSVFDAQARLLATHIGEYFAERAVERAARSKLEEMGFAVEKVSRLSIRISGTARLFRRRMGVRFEKDRSDMFLPTLESGFNALQLGSQVLDGVAFPQPLLLHGKPEELSPAGTVTGDPPTVVAGSPGSNAALDRLRISPTAPALGYYHLRAPEDIATILNAESAHAAGWRGQGVKVAMIDSGFDWSHPYFRGKGYSLSAAPPSNQDPLGHGTGESANLLAVAPRARLYGLNMDDVIGAFQSARDSLKVKIISNSWGSLLPTDGPFSSWDPYWSLVLAEISLSVRLGVAVLFSSGNGGISVTASSPDVISVGGVYRDETGRLLASNCASSFRSFRFRGRRVPDVCGLCGCRPKGLYIALPVPPGSAMDRDLAGGTWPDRDMTLDNDGWGVFSGTSAACPMVAGVIALMLSKNPSLSLDEIRQKLFSSCRDVTQGNSGMGDRAGRGRDLATGYGLIDAAAACV